MAAKGETATLWLDGHTMRTIPLSFSVEELATMGNWRLLAEGWGMVLCNPYTQECMAHLHGQNIMGCFKGSRICMECGEEWPKDLEGFVNLRLSGMR